MSRAYHLLLICILPALAWPLLSQADGSDTADSINSLSRKYDEIRPMLKSNQYNAPIYIESKFHDNDTIGEIYAQINNDFRTVEANLTSSGNWCEVLFLHVNVKGCDNHTKTADKNAIKVYVGRNYYQTPDEAYSMQYHFAVERASKDYLRVNMSADSGPFGTSDYLLTFEAIPFAKDTTFLHLKYSYRYGVLAKMAINTYLATLGRNKVGFTVKGYDENHHPIYVKGLQGIVERNSMRYFIAIQSYLDTVSLNRKQWSTRVEHWYQLAEPFQRQLIEVEDRKYVETKQKEYSDRDKLETAAISPPDNI